MTYTPDNEYPYISEPNGCGSGWNETFVPDKVGGVDLTPACNSHDECYGTVGSTKDYCDESFRDDLEALDAPSYVTDVYVGAVELLGNSAYQEAQQEANDRSPDWQVDNYSENTCWESSSQDWEVDESQYQDSASFDYDDNYSDNACWD